MTPPVKITKATESGIFICWIFELILWSILASDMVRCSSNVPCWVLENLKSSQLSVLWTASVLWCLWVILIFIETKSVTSGSGVIVCKSSDNIFRNVEETQNQSFPEPPTFRFCFALNLNVKYIILIKNLFQLKCLSFCQFVFRGFLFGFLFLVFLGEVLC